MQKYAIFKENESNKSSLKPAIIKNIEIIAIIQVNIEAKHIVFAI